MSEILYIGKCAPESSDCVGRWSKTLSVWYQKPKEIGETEKDVLPSDEGMVESTELC